jgi:hypothetical protein
MPDANGNFKGMRVNAAAWERIFGRKPERDTTPDAADRWAEQNPPTLPLHQAWGDA